MQEYKRIYGDTVFSEDRHFGRDLYERIKVSLVGECKPYAILFDSLRYNSIKKLNQDSVTIQLKNLDTVGLVRRNKDYFNQKSLLFFQAKMYDSSLANANKVLNIDSTNTQAMYFKGWVDEIKGNYDEAIFLYDKVAALTKQDNFLIFSALAKRKKNGM
jgi:tetratricopeptide (TPR) repeat protein